MKISYGLLRSLEGPEVSNISSNLEIHLKSGHSTHYGELYTRVKCTLFSSCCIKLIKCVIMYSLRCHSRGKKRITSILGWVSKRLEKMRAAERTSKGVQRNSDLYSFPVITRKVKGQ